MVMMSRIKGNSALHDFLDPSFLGGSLNKDCIEAVDRQAEGNKKKSMTQRERKSIFNDG